MLKRYIFSEINIFSRKSHYRKMVIFYSCFTLSIITLSSFILISHFNKILTNEARTSNKKLLTQINIYSDTILYESVNSLVNEKFLSLSSDKNILDFFLSSRPNDTDVLYRVYNNLLSVVSGSSIIDSIYVYRLSDNTLISSREGVFLSILKSDDTMSRYVNFKLIEDMMSSQTSNKWVSPFENNEFLNEINAFQPNQPIISFIQSVPIIAQSSNKLGYVVININEKRLYDSINHISDINFGELLVLDTSGKVFLHSKRSEILKSINLEGYTKDTLYESNGFKISGMDDGYYSIAWTRSRLNNWVYVLITPVNILNRELYLAKQLAVALTAFIAMFALLGLRFITFRLYKPIQVLFRSTTDKFNIKDKNTDELAIIGSVIDTLSTKVDEMEDIIQRNQGVIRYQLAIDIISGNISEIDVINERLKLIDEQMPYSNFCILIAEPDVRGINLLTHEQREYTIYKIIEMMDSYFCTGCMHISVPLNPKRIMAILNFESYEYVQSKLLALMQQVKAQTGLNCNIAFSGKTDDILHIHSFYEQGEYLLKYSFIYNYGNIFIQDIMNGFKKNDKCFDFSILDSLPELLKSCKISVIKEKITQIFSLFKNGNYSYDHVQSMLIQLFGVFCKVVKEQKMDESIDINSIFLDFNAILSLDECHQWIFNLIDIYEKNVTERNTFIDTVFIDRISAYICENVEGQLSLNSVAEEFKISPNYLSKIFKDGTGMKFSDFLLQKKLEKAKELLLSDKKITITQIANMLGYYNSTYFISLFKRNFGITPGMFRKENLSPASEDANNYSPN